MGTQASSVFKIESWDEQPYIETEDGGKLTRAKVTQAIEGDIDGRAEIEWLMCYRPDQTADFVGLTAEALWTVPAALVLPAMLVHALRDHFAARRDRCTECDRICRARCSRRGIARARASRRDASGGE